MPKYTDEDIRNMSKITCKIAADYLGISPMAVSIGMRNDLLPIGFAIHNEERDRTYSESWSYHIIGERLIAYKYGKTSEVQVQNIEKSLNTIIEQFEEMKKDLVFLLSENENQQNYSFMNMRFRLENTKRLTKNMQERGCRGGERKRKS